MPNKRNKVTPKGGNNTSGYAAVRPGRGNNVSAWTPPKPNSVEQAAGGLPINNVPNPRLQSRDARRK